MRTVIITLTIVFAAFLLPAQSPGSEFIEYTSEHFLIRVESNITTARNISLQLEAMYTFFNQYFRFPEKSSGLPLKVTILNSKPEFDAYLRPIIQRQYNGYVYLHYGVESRNELVGFVSNLQEVTVSLVQQAFQQYLKHHIKNPPLWISEGFGGYIRDAQFDAQTQQINFVEKSETAESIQISLDENVNYSLLPMNTVLSMTRESLAANNTSFYTTIWALFSYLLNDAPPHHSRILWDSIAYLSSSASAADNLNKLGERVYSWIDYSSLDRNILAYVQNYETPYTLLGKGQSLMQENKYAEAEEIFKRVTEIQPSGVGGYYYLGYANYHQGKYDSAIVFYEQAQTYGLDANLGNLAIALAYHSMGDTDRAIDVINLVEPSSKHYARSQELLREWN